MNFLKKYCLPTILLLLVVLAVSCEEFQTENFAMPAKDALACTQLADTLSDSVTTVNIVRIDSAWSNAAAGGFVGEILDSLENRNVVLAEGEGKYTLFTPSGLDTNYVSLQTSGGLMVVFVADWIDVDLIKTDGTVRRPSSSHIFLETAFECENIKVRYEISAEAGSNLFRIIKNDQTRLSSFDITVLKN